MRVVACCVVLVFSLFNVSSARADDIAIGGTSGSVYPISKNNIELSSEAVQITLFDGFAEYRVDFFFHNTGATEKVRLGFPYALPHPEDPTRGDTTPAAFRAWSEGQRLRVTRTRGRDQTGPVGWFEHAATFKPGANRISVSYLCKSNSSSGPIMYDQLTAPPSFGKEQLSTDWIEYWMHTGEGWRGPIGRALVRLQLSDGFPGIAVDQLIEANASQPDGARFGSSAFPIDVQKTSESTYVWDMRSFEPVVDSNGLSENDVSFAYYVPHSFDTSSAGAPTAQTPFRATGATASSSSDQASPPSAAIDQDPSTSWSALDTKRDTPWIKVELAAETSIGELRILPGAAASEDVFTHSRRPKTVIAKFSDGSQQTLHLADDPSVQRFAVSTNTKWVRLEVTNTYGPVSGNAGVSIAEVQVGKNPAPSASEASDLLGITTAPATTDTSPSALPTTSLVPAAGGSGESGSDGGLLMLLVSLAFVAGTWFTVTQSNSKP